MGYRNFKILFCVLSLVGLLNTISTSQAISPEIWALKTVVIDAGSFSYRASGQYLKDGSSIDAPKEKVTFTAPFEIMAYQVRVGEYEQCVLEEACRKRLGQGRQNDELPVTGVSHRDATDFANWLSRKTGENWRLPTDEEWAYAAGSRRVDDAVNVDPDSKNPAKRWLAKYQKYADQETGADPIIKPLGSYGANEFGVFDMSGNIWEWTNNCYVRTRVDAEDNILSTIRNCGVHIAAGQHRAYISFFIQDAKGGGCSVGQPADYLGFRLVKDGNRNVLENFLNFIGL